MGDGPLLMGRQPASAAGRAGGKSAIKQEKEGIGLTGAFPNASSFHSDTKRLLGKSGVAGVDDDTVYSTRTHGGGATATSQMANDNTAWTAAEFVEEHNAYRCELGLEPLAWQV